MLYGEQDRGLPFIRYVNPTELDKARDAMEKLLRLKYPGIDIANLHLWKMIGWDGGPIEEFLNQYMQWARKNQTSLNQVNRNFFVDEMIANKIYSDRAIVNEYIDVFLQAYNTKQVSDTIYQPWMYEEKELGSVIGTEIGKQFNKVLVAAIVALAVYGIATSFIPQIARASQSKKPVFT